MSIGRSSPLDQIDPLLLFRQLVRVRLIEEAIADHYSEQEMRCPVHLSIGQEATAVGACAALNDRDVIVSNHRCHGHYLAKGGDLDAMLGELYGRVIGCCGGRGGSMHLFDDQVGVLASVPIVGTTIPIGVGAALAFQQRADDSVSLVFLGDAATEEGVFHESANFASTKGLPVIFFIENNFFSVYTPIRDRQPDRALSEYARAHDMPCEVVDGNDVEAVYEITYKMTRRAREGRGPGLIVADTYRWREHCGPNFDNHLGYRSSSEFEKWKTLCPVEKYRNELFQRGILDKMIEYRMESIIKDEIEKSFTRVRNAPFPDPDDEVGRVYA
jgi:TPP-dependent pyruvate/acetoin dehydrogenase alpha subunit